MDVIVRFIALKTLQLLGFLLLWWVLLFLWDVLVASGFFIYVLALVVGILFIGVLAYMLVFD